MTTPPTRAHGRAADALRPFRITTGTMKHAEGSALVEAGDTRVLVSASVENRVPYFLRDKGEGWVTAEYAMLPRSTHTRNQRESKAGRQSGRSAEIQRLIGRSLRAVIDRSRFPDRTVTIDCDVIQADGGTRTAAITGAWVALAEAFARMLLTGDIAAWPLVGQVAAVSVGLVDGRPLLDLDYPEDAAAEVDLNLVASAAGEIVEIQGTGESRTFRRDELDALVDLALAGITELTAIQTQSFAATRAEVDAVLAKSDRRPAPAKNERDLWGAP
jgi:ribonuclease PH